MLFAGPLAELVAELERLPGIGPKSAQRLAFHLLRLPDEAVFRLADVLRSAKLSLRFCARCQNFSEDELCEICGDPGRDPTTICVVAEPRDVGAMERIHEYRGLYHVLHGLLDPMAGVGPERLRIQELVSRVPSGVAEVIVATNPTAEGDATALYLARLLKPLGVKVTRLAHGMPYGGELDYADTATLHSALRFRRAL